MNDFLDYIKNKLRENIKIEKVLIVDNSSQHKKHKSFDAKKYHIKLEIESIYLKSLNKIKAHREIMTILSNEMKTKIHALEIEIK
jgi:stress-induced morphogen